MSSYTGTYPQFDVFPRLRWAFWSSGLCDEGVGRAKGKEVDETRGLSCLGACGELSSSATPLPWEPCTCISAR
jgi:hypothetical protein